MKLTKKGLKRLHNEAVRYIENGTICHQPIGYDQMEALHNFEFRPDDFEGVVVLSLDEAKKAHNCVMIETANLINDFSPSELIRELEVLCESLRKKIEEVEKDSEQI